MIVGRSSLASTDFQSLHLVCEHVPIGIEPGCEPSPVQVSVRVALKTELCKFLAIGSVR